MSKTRVVLNNAGFNELRKSPEMRALLEEVAREKAGSDCDYKVVSAGTRLVAKVIDKKGDGTALKRTQSK